MLNYISNDDLIPNSSISQQSKISGIDKKAAAKNPYSQITEFADTTEISDEAIKLFEREKDVEKFTSMVLDTLNSPESEQELNSIMESISSGGYISNDSLADKILSKENMLNFDFSDMFETEDL